jgi:hypothetical protein
MATSAGYSGTPFFKKLGFRDGMTDVGSGLKLVIPVKDRK